jgi:hypothetical protein
MLQYHLGTKLFEVLQTLDLSLEHFLIFDGIVK